MATPAQIEANRANAQLSTGPRTPEGKAVARYNRLRHGLRAEAVLMPDENPDDYEALTADLWEQLQPLGPLEEAITDRIVTQLWRLRRVARIEAGVLRWHLLSEQLEPDGDPNLQLAGMLRGGRGTARHRLGCRPPARRAGRIESPPRRGTRPRPSV
jgi:hypothetical protein